MGCGCKTKHTNSKRKKAARQLRISLNVLDMRRGICENCAYSTKRKTNRKGTVSRIGPGSRCLKSKKSLNKALKDPKYSCPMKKFKTAKKKKLR